MDVLNTVVLGNTLKAWGIAIIVAGAGYLVLEALRRLLVRNLGRFAKRTTRTSFDDLVVEVIDRTRAFFIAVIALYAGTRYLTLAPRLESIISDVFVAALVLQGGLWGNHMVRYFIRLQLRLMGEDEATETTLGALSFLGKLLLWAVLVLLGLENVGIHVTALVAGMGVGGIALALAVQKILGDLFASLSIVLDKPFVLGDFIIVDSYMGTVEHIGLKTTRVRSLGGEQLVFGNNDLLSSRIRNYKRMNERRIVFAFGVTYDTPREKLEQIPGIVKSLIESHEGQTRFDRAHFKSFGDSSLDFEVVYYVLSAEYNVYMDIQQALNLELYSRFDEMGIEFAFPTRTVFVVGDGSAVSATSPA